MAGGAFELFAPQELGTEAYKYLFILENEKSNPANINKTGNKEYIFTRRHDPVIILLVSTLHKGVWAMPCTLLAKWLICICKAMGYPSIPKRGITRKWMMNIKIATTA